jgi:hypothetical protein
MRRHSLCRAEITPSNLRVSLRRVSKAIVISLRNFIHCAKKRVHDIVGRTALLVSQNGIGTHA